MNKIAQFVQESGRRLGLDVDIQTIDNPRKELEEHYYNPANTGLHALGLEPHYLTETVLDELMLLVMRYKANINKDAIFRGVKFT